MNYYTFAATVSHYNEEAEDILADFVKVWAGKEEVVSTEASVVEDSHVSGIVSFRVTSEKNQSIFSKISELIKEHDLKGECWTLTDN